MGCTARLQEGRPCLRAIVGQAGRLEYQKRHYRRYCPHTRIPHEPFGPLPSWGACMVPREGRPIAPASSSADHTQSPTGIAIRSNHPSTPQTAMDRIQTEPSTLHSTDYSAPLNRNLQTTEPHYSRIQSADRTVWSRPIDPRTQCRVVCRHGVGRNPSRIPQLHRHNRAGSCGFPPNYMTQPKRSVKRQLHLIHHAEDRLCVWNPSRADMVQLRQFDFRITYVTGWRAYLGNAQHNYAHWTKVALPEGRHDLSTLEQIPGVLPFEVYAQAPLRLISWCSFELDHRAKALVRELAILCETSTTTIAELVEHIGQRHANIHTEQAAIPSHAGHVHIASRAQMPSYTTMVQQFLGTLKLPMAIYMLDYYLPMLSPNDGYNETGLTMQSAGPVREEWHPIQLSYLFEGSEFGHWKVTGGYDAFAFRHPSLAQTDVCQLLESEAHHHKVCPIGTGRLIAMVGVAHAEDATTGTLSVLFGLVLGITPRTSKNKNELPAARIHRQCNPKAIEVAFLTVPATEFFAEDQFQVLQDRYLARGHGLSATVPTNAALTNFLLKDMWMFGITKSTSELTAVAQTPECRYHLGLGINNVQVAVNGMDGDKRSYLLSLCGQLLKQVLTACHIAIQASPGSGPLLCLTQLKWMGTFWARSAQSPWPFSPTDLTCASKGYLEQESPNPWRSSYLHSSNSTLNTSLKSCSSAKKTQVPAPLRTSCNGLTRQRRCLSDSGGLSEIKKGTNPAIHTRDLTSTQENEDKCSVSVNLSWLQAAQSVKISPCSGQQ